MTAPRTQGKDNQYWTGFPLRFFICAWKFHPSFGWLSPEIRKDGMNMYYDLIESGKRVSVKSFAPYKLKRRLFAALTVAVSWKCL